MVTEDSHYLCFGFDENIQPAFKRKQLENIVVVARRLRGGGSRLQLGINEVRTKLLKYSPFQVP
jgi:hypothetical protein